MMIDSMQSSHAVKNFRFIDDEYNPQLFPTVNEYLVNELLTLEQCLESFVTRIDRLDQIIQIAKENCHFPCEHYLTHDESAAIFLYTIEWDGTNLYQLITQDFRSQEQSTSKLWFPYLKLFYTAIDKLPNVHTNVWRIIPENMRKELNKNDEFICWSITSCSSSIDVIREFSGIGSRLLMIETVTGKNISKYSNSPDQHEVILCPGTRFRFLKSNLPDPMPLVDIVYLQEITDPNDAEAANSVTKNCLIRTSISKIYKKWLILLLMHIIILALALFLFNSKIEVWTTFELSNSTVPSLQAIRPLFSFIYSLSQMMKNDKLSIIHVQIDERGNKYDCKSKYYVELREWKDGKKHGKGKMNYANGHIYTGDWVEDLATGEGIFAYTNGDQYEGQYKNGQRHGKGFYTYINGDNYTGDWLEDKKSGQGIIIWGPNSTWANDRYEGEFYNDHMHGQGTYYFANGDTYTGGWVMNQQDGQGIFNFASGDRFEMNGSKIFHQHTFIF
ncbi:unnamed protein product [Rotaria socialis]|uniref:NAD(P)(+)--arginine ADP-ribosyltransferase n=2 Tax=Rotaria socialis TaxID=392032 RepID=A0A818GI85_9BILA|nr:unnamed protein product [Rotaria socialis]CAF4632695.1 unnamed protein product [Rotaria socialis]